MAQEIIQIEGMKALAGKITVAGAKNAALPLMIAALLSKQKVELTNIPNLYDVAVLGHLLESLGSKVVRNGSTISIHTEQIVSSEARYSLVKALRASFWVLAPLLARTGSAKVSLPGGDILGNRAVDIHLDGLRALGAKIDFEHGTVYAKAPSGLHPAEIEMKFPSVGATHQLLMATSLIEGQSIIKGVAKEPEIVAVADLLNSMGAEVTGAGTDTILVKGRKELGSGNVTVIRQRVIGDRIEAGTYICCALASHLAKISSQSIEICGFEPEHLGAFLDLLKLHGANIEVCSESVRVLAGSKMSNIVCKTEPFPGFPTDLQAPFCALLAQIAGQNCIEETIYDGRFGHVQELQRMGLDIRVEGKKIIINGGKQLSAADVEGMDIRGAASLVVAALCAEGVTSIHAPAHLRRGYEFLERKLAEIGANIKSAYADQDDFAFAGC